MKPELKTRQEQIDLQLGRAGWATGSRRMVEEFFIEKAGCISGPKTDYGTRIQFVDYALLDRLGRPLAIVEARKCSCAP